MLGCEQKPTPPVSFDVIASLRATATQACHANAVAQLEAPGPYDDNFFEIRRCELAASYSAWRMNLSPHLLMLPEISSAPD
jgi:hypothetical protein